MFHIAVAGSSLQLLATTIMYNFTNYKIQLWQPGYHSLTSIGSVNTCVHGPSFARLYSNHSHDLRDTISALAQPCL